MVKSLPSLTLTVGVTCFALNERQQIFEPVYHEVVVIITPGIPGDVARQRFASFYCIVHLVQKGENGFTLDLQFVCHDRQ